MNQLHNVASRQDVAAASTPDPGKDILSQIAVGLAAESDLEALLARFLGPIVNLAGAVGGAVRVLASDAVRMRLVGSVGLPQEVVRCDDMVTSRCGVCGEALEEGDFRQTADIGTCARNSGSVYFGGGCRSVLAIPLRHRGRVLGVYNLFMKDDRAVADDVSPVLLAIGELLGLALENTRLAQENLRMSLMAERQMLANEVHDSLAQALVYMKTRVSLMEDAITKHDDARALRYVDDLGRELGNAHCTMRELLAHFRSRMESGGLLRALHRIADSYYDRTGVYLAFTNRVPDLDLTAEQEVQVFHIIQEALANIGKHAHAHHARLAIDTHGGDYEIIIDDDGSGVAASRPQANENAAGHYGMRIMHERAAALGGELIVEGVAAGKGTRVCLRFPVAVAHRGTTQ